ncbi:hypothetical protein E2R51_05900 [Jeotgalibacillus sp. S-D1]|uniref:PepSY domain-containing protein n=1 Tax=Jeotgalibacillus sp. S-D1 TaxID=2552189 RepID=UPI00105945BD|nr:PepSY domain-containing protein [Jeotgalibacillus sp. S-D1]TDL35251.1 hypothetical protein E2R51_05900 [Jeotgalibacillus sp. S-D1]
MKKQRMIWMAGGALLLVILVFVAVQFVSGMSAASPLTENEAVDIVTDRYPEGEIQSVGKYNNGYSIEFVVPNGIYEMKINKDSAEIESLMVIENTASDAPGKNPDSQKEILSEKEIREIVSESSGVIQSIEKVEKQNKTVYEAVISEDDLLVTKVLDPYTGAELSVSKEAEKDNAAPLTEPEAIDIALKAVPGEVDDVDLEHSDEEMYFLIEIDTADDREATVQVNAISGKIMSTTWDD